jgi:hypothetical protein
MTVTRVDHGGPGALPYAAKSSWTLVSSDIKFPIEERVLAGVEL